MKWVTNIFTKKHRERITELEKRIEYLEQVAIGRDELSLEEEFSLSIKYKSRAYNNLLAELVYSDGDCPYDIAGLQSYVEEDDKGYKQCGVRLELKSGVVR